MGRRGFLAATVVVGALLAGCAGEDGTQLSPPRAEQPLTATPAPVDPTALIGNWHLVGVAEEPQGVLRVAPHQIQLFGRCGMHTGSWRADSGGLFVAAMFGISGPRRGDGCTADPRQLLGWLQRATGYRLDGDTPVLVDEAGAQVARLRPGATPTPGPHLAPSEVAPPTLTDEDRRRFAPAAALPANLRPVDPARLVGRWAPARGPETVYVEFRADGEWRGSDGCNGQGGRWVAGPGGALLATSGPSTLIGCEGEPVGAWLSSAWRAGLDGETLVLLDAGAGEIGRLRPAG